jgi:hypothetical protein
MESTGVAGVRIWGRKSLRPCSRIQREAATAPPKGLGPIREGFPNRESSGRNLAVRIVSCGAPSWLVANSPSRGGVLQGPQTKGVQDA